MLIYFGIICGIGMLAFVLLMLALKFSRYKVSETDGHCSAGCQCSNKTCRNYQSDVG